ncbi:hypothetical protein [Thomasclavelia cocleata]|jgi:hypothetical protein|nr:hypothetical protein [Thomasclavelia cocleata]
MDREQYMFYINEFLNEMSDTSLKKVFDYTQWRYVQDYDISSDNNPDKKECGSHE